MRLSLRAKWTVALLVAGALPLAVLAFLTLTIQRRGLETTERLLQVAIIDHVGDVVDRTLREAAEATHRVGRTLTEGKIGDDDARLELSREGMARAEALDEVAIYDPEGKLLDAIRRVESSPTAKTAAPPPERL